MLISLSYKDKTRQSKTAIVFSLGLKQTEVASEHFFTLVYLSFQPITNLLPPQLPYSKWHILPHSPLLLKYQYSKYTTCIFVAEHCATLTLAEYAVIITSRWGAGFWFTAASPPRIWGIFVFIDTTTTFFLPSIKLQINTLTRCHFHKLYCSLH